MAVSSTDDMGAYVDTGVNVVPTQRPSDRTDYHTTTGVVEADPARADRTLHVPPARRAPSQRR